MMLKISGNITFALRGYFYHWQLRL